MRSASFCAGFRPPTWRLDGPALQRSGVDILFSRRTGSSNAATRPSGWNTADFFDIARGATHPGRDNVHEVTQPAEKT